MRSATQREAESPRRTGLTRLTTTLVGLQCKATVLVVGLMLLIATILCGFSVERAWLLAGQLEHEQAVQHAIMAAKLSADAMQRDDREAIGRLAADLVTGDPLWFIQFADVAGHVIGSAESVPGLLEDKRARGTKGNVAMGVAIHGVLPDGRGKYLDVSYPIYRPGRTNPQADSEATRLLGHVRLGISRDRTISKFNATADLFIAIAVAIVVLSVPLAFLVVRRIVVPLNAMSRTAQRFSKGDLKARTSVRRSDEIGVLAGNLNAMADEVERKHCEIVTLNAELEDRVMERTAQLRELAIREPLTGLYNRRHFAEVLTRRFSEARRYGSDLALVMIDVDDFKGVNDELGHQAGDELLILASLIISSQLRAADVAARFGGDEFIILLPQSNGDHAQRLVDRIVSRFRRESREKFPNVRATLSVGVASLAETETETDEEFVRAADRAMYDAKAAGKDRIVVATTSVQYSAEPRRIP